MKLDNLNYPYTLSEQDVWSIIESNKGLINMNFRRFNTGTFTANGFQDNNNVEFLAMIFEDLHSNCIGVEVGDFVEAWNVFITLPMQRIANRLKRASDKDIKYGFVSLDAHSSDNDSDPEAEYSSKLVRELANGDGSLEYSSEYNVGLSRVSHLPYMEDDFAEAMCEVAYNEFCLNTPKQPLMSVDEFKSAVSRMFMKHTRSVRDLNDMDSTQAEKLMRKIRTRGRRMGREAVTELLRETVEALPSPSNYA